VHIKVGNDAQSRKAARKLFDERLHEVRSIAARKKEGAADFTGSVTVGLFCDFDDRSVRPLSWSINVPKDSTSVVLFEIQPTATTNELIEHLMSNQLYYSQVVWRALNPATIGMLLSKYTWYIGGQERPLVELVDPNPVAIAANYLVLRLSGDDLAEHDAWLQKKNIIEGSCREDLVPVPSGGVFAEAVLGRFNSAEKLDITRFWNWEDSPIPIQAPDIAAIQAGSRREADTTTPSQLGAPVLNIVSPPSLPDPQGMGAVLAAVQNGNMFRDMSGLAATIGLAQAGLAAAQQGASDASTQAGKNAEVAAQLGAKVAEIAGKIVGAYLSGGKSLAALGGGGGQDGMINSDKGISKTGSMLNDGRGMDNRGVPSQGSAGNGTAPLSSPGLDGTGAAPDYARGFGSTGYAAPGTPAGGNESTAYNTGLGGGAGFTLVSSGGGASGAAVQKGVELVSDVAGDALKHLATKYIDTPKLKMDKIDDSAALLSAYSDPSDYSTSPPPRNMTRQIKVRFDNLGGGPFFDGFTGLLEISWVDYNYLNDGAMSAADQRRSSAMQNIMCKTDIQVLPSGMVGGAWSEVEVNLDLVVAKRVDQWEAEINYYGKLEIRMRAVVLVSLALTPTAGPGGTKVQTIRIPLDPILETPTWYLVQDNDDATGQPYTVLRFGGELPAITTI